MEYTFLSATLLLILITDPFGNIPLFANTLKAYDHTRRWKIILREHGIAFAILLGFMFVGDNLLKAIGLSGASLQIAGGVVLFLIAIRMIFPPLEGPDAELDHEPFIVPLAVPLIAGPSTLATVLLLASQSPDKILDWIGALTIAISVSAAVLVTASKIQKYLGSRVITAIERLMGLILVALSVEMISRGIKGFL